MMTMFSDVCSFKNLYVGLKKSCRNVRWKTSVITYESNAIKNTHKLREQLLAGKYKPKGYQVFTIHEPKERIIKATKIVDRQFQHSLCDNLVYGALTKSLIVDSCACLEGRGVDYCLNRITKHMVEYRKQYQADGWVLKCDIHKFFDSINHDLAKAAVHKRLHDPDACHYVCQIIDSFEGDTGIGLGSQLSQLIANAFLDDLDHFIKEKLHIRHYIRYMDDFVLFYPDKRYLQYCKEQINNWLTEHKLAFNPKTCIYPFRQGIKMLHWHFTVMPSGKILRRMECTRQSKQRKILRTIISKEARGEVPEHTAIKTHMSWLANADRGNTYYLRKQMHAYYNGLMAREGLYGSND